MKQFTVLFCAALVLVLGGCQAGPSMKPFGVQVQIDEGVNHNFTMDFIPLGAADQELRTYDVGRYFDPASPGYRQQALRQTDGISRSFRGDDSGTFEIITAGDQRWRQWRRDGVMDFMVLVNRFAVETAAGPDRETVPDARKRVVIPLDSRQWEQRDREITIHIQRSRMTYRPQPKPVN